MLRLLNPLATPRPDRDRLKSAIAARDAARRAVEDARTTLKRIETVVNAADDAARMAAKATSAAAEARREWVRGGCKHSESIQLQVQDDAAAEAARVASRAAADAEVVRKAGALARANDAVQLARSSLRGSEEEIGAAIGAIIAEEAAPLLERLENLAKEYRTLRAEIIGVQRVVDPPMFEDESAASSEGARLIAAALARAKIESFDDELAAARTNTFITTGQRVGDATILDPLSAPYRERAAQLRNDPDA